MKISGRRFALLTGVSISAMGVPSAAFAATQVTPGIGHIDTTDPVEDTLVICDIGDSCFFGVEADGAGVVGAVVNSVASGRIEQIGHSLNGDVDLNIINDGTAEIAAHAVASESGGPAQANASIFDAVYQSGAGPDDVRLGLTNNGELLIDAVATRAATRRSRGQQPVDRGSAIK